VSEQNALRRALMGLETGIGVDPEAARGALQAAGLTQLVELRDGGRPDNA
jgi:hypothetical protein